VDIGTKFKIHSLQKSLSGRGLEERGRVQKFIDSEVLRKSEPYIPMDTGKLKQSGISGTTIGSGKVVYNSPYARYQYYGKVMVGSAPKRLTSTNLSYHAGDSRRGSYWFERMKADHVGDILKGAAKMLGGRT
jgi:hypothetical protein